MILPAVRERLESILRHPSMDAALAALERACAELRNDASWSPADDGTIAPKVLGHRVTTASRSSLSSRRNPNDAAGERIIEEILSQIDVPL